MSSTKCIFDSATKRGKDYAREPVAGEFMQILDNSTIEWFLFTPSRYQFDGSLSEFPGWQEEQDALAVQAAVSAKNADIEAKCNELQSADFPWSGHNFYCEDDDRNSNIPSTALVSSLLPDADPIPTDQPYPGCWVTSADSSGARVPVPFTNAEFRQFAIAVYRRTSALWGKEKIHLATVAAMAAGGSTAAQIAAYDINTGW